jgi:hypothetical protein
MNRIKMKMKVIYAIVSRLLLVAQTFTYLHAILQLRNYGAFGDEHEQLAAPCEWERDDEGEEDGHLSHQKEEHLYEKHK